MAREVNLIEYLPDFLRRFIDFQKLYSSENPELTLLWSVADNLLDNLFLQTADEIGIARFEALMEITPSEGDDLRSRRTRLMSKWLSLRPYTEKRLQEMLTDLCGEGGFELTVDASAFSVDVKVSLGVKNQKDIVAQMLRNILPANLIYTVDLLYNTWSGVSAETWGGFRTHTWRTLKEEVL